MKRISIVIPCYNSEATIRKVVEMVMEEFKKMDEKIKAEKAKEFESFLKKSE